MLKIPVRNYALKATLKTLLKIINIKNSEN